MQYDRFESAATQEQGQSALRRGEILAAAATLFAEHGFHGASMRDIGERVGLLKGSLYVHIANKDEILVEIVGDTARRLNAAVSPVLLATARPSDKLRMALKAHLLFASSNQNSMFVLQHESKHLTGQPHMWICEWRLRYQQLWWSAVDVGVRCGDLRQDLDIACATDMLLAAANLNATFDMTSDTGAVADRRWEVLRGGLLP